MIYCMASTRHIVGLPAWPWLSRKEKLNMDFLESLNPRAVFVPYWHWKISKDITDKFECVGFHCTPLPFGRGGSPIENMIERKLLDTKLTAFRMTDELDAGPIYIQRNMSLDGSMFDVLERMDIIIRDMIYDMIGEWPIPMPQVGEPVYFKRKTDEEKQLIHAGMK